MRKLVALAALTAACGGADFAGTYSGSITERGSCSDGSGVNRTGSVSWVVTQSGGSVTIATGGNCGELSGTVSGNVVNVSQKTCPATTNNGITMTQTLTGGTLTLTGGSLGVSLTANYQLASGYGSGTCSGTTTGTLSR